MPVEKTVRSNSQPDVCLGLRLTQNSGKKKMNTEISTWNVRRMLQTGKMIESQRDKGEEDLITMGIKKQTVNEQIWSKM